MKSALTVVALVNGMIGGLILVLPLLTIQTGSVLSIIVLFIIGFFSFYSCYLCLRHLGNHTDLDKAMYFHFGQSPFMKNLYNFLIFLNLCFILLLYFSLIVQQWKGLLPYNLANPICNALGLLGLVFLLNYFHMGAKLMGYGIISILAYCVFLVWVIATAPSGNNTIPQFSKGGVNLASAMNGGFAIQMFFIPVLKQLPDSSHYVRFTLLAYLIGGCIYTYIAYGGAFGVLNREVVRYPVQTIQDYFKPGQWQVSVIQVIYLVHLYSAFGKFLLVCKKRFFSMFATLGLKQSNHGEMLKPTEMLFAVVIIGAAMGIWFAQVSIQIIIQINGAVIGFFFVYLLPALMHFKCLYVPNKKKLICNTKNLHTDKGLDMQLSDVNSVITQRQSIATQFITSNMEHNNNDNKAIQIKIEDRNQDKEVVSTQQHKNGVQGELDKQLTIQLIDLQCKCKKPNIFLQVADVASVAGMIGVGLFIMVDQFISLAATP